MRVSVVLDCQAPDALVPFWGAALGYELTEALDGYRILLPAPGQPVGPVFILQQVSEPRRAKNRMHLDVHPGDAPAHIARLETLGATRVGDRIDAHGVWWQVLADPEGNELCVVAHATGPDQTEA